MTTGESACCRSPMRPLSNGPTLVIQRCPSCGTLWADHLTHSEGRPWEESYVPERFAAALQQRRQRQSHRVVELIGTHCGHGRVLDYGTGQGVLLRDLLAAGYDAWGCDIDTDVPLYVAPRDRLIALDRPWALPDGKWDTVVMLDVLEHHHDPVAFLRSLDCRNVVLKLPTSNGPFTSASRVLAKAGRRSILEHLFLEGENFPHHWLPTRRGVSVIAHASGWAVVATHAIVEVGAELPDRSRADLTTWARPLVAAAGMMVGALGHWWSDAVIAVLKRSRSAA
jgi:SAM-dependent methyltransferase